MALAQRPSLAGVYRGGEVFFDTGSRSLDAADAQWRDPAIPARDVRAAAANARTFLEMAYAEWQKVVMGSLGWQAPADSWPIPSDAIPDDATSGQPVEGEAPVSVAAVEAAAVAVVAGAPDEDAAPDDWWAD